MKPIDCFRISCEFFVFGKDKTKDWQKYEGNILLFPYAYSSNDLEDGESIEKLFELVALEEHDHGLIAQLLTAGEWYLFGSGFGGYGKDEINDPKAIQERIKRIWSEYNEVEKRNMRDISKWLNNKNAITKPYVFKENPEIPFKLTLSILLKYISAHGTEYDNFTDAYDELKGEGHFQKYPEINKITAEIFKALNVFIREYNALSSKIMAKCKKINN